MASFSSAGTARGHLPPWEACKAFAFSKCLNAIAQKLGQPACERLGQHTTVALMWLEAPAYGPGLPPPPGPAAQMEASSVRDAVSFFESKDARALGQKLEASTATGADLMRLSVRSLQRSLSFNAFAAQKVCNLRDMFLRAGAARRH